MFTIAKTFSFSAAHALDHLPESHPCHGVHGHNYTVTVILESEDLDEHSFVVDYHDIKAAMASILRELDHAFLNDVLDFPPTSEALAEYIYLKIGIPELSAVRVSETPSTWAEYRW